MSLQKLKELFPVDAIVRCELNGFGKVPATAIRRRVVRHGVSEIVMEILDKKNHPGDTYDRYSPVQGEFSYITWSPGLELKQTKTKIQVLDGDHIMLQFSIEPAAKVSKAIPTFRRLKSGALKRVR